MLLRESRPSIPCDTEVRGRAAAREMNIPQLEITRQDAKIEVTSHRAQMHITSTRPSFRLKRTYPSMRVNRQQPQMNVDRSNMAVLLNKAPIILAGKLYTDQARQNVMDAIGQIASEGTALMSIESPGNTVAGIAEQMADRDFMELDLTAVPPPVVSWDTGFFEVNWTPASMETKWDVSPMVDIRVEPHHVDIRMAKHAKVTIRVVYKNQNRDRKSGGKFFDKYL
jgi:hypothetical protein